MNIRKKDFCETLLLNFCEWKLCSALFLAVFEKDEIRFRNFLRITRGDNLVDLIKCLNINGYLDNHSYQRLVSRAT